MPPLTDEQLRDHLDDVNARRSALASEIAQINTEIKQRQDRLRQRSARMKRLDDQAAGIAAVLTAMQATD